MKIPNESARRSPVNERAKHGRVITCRNLKSIKYKINEVGRAELWPHAAELAPGFERQT